MFRKLLVKPVCFPLRHAEGPEEGAHLILRDAAVVVNVHDTQSFTHMREPLRRLFAYLLQDRPEFRTQPRRELSSAPRIRRCYGMAARRCLCAAWKALRWFWRLGGEASHLIHALAVWGNMRSHEGDELGAIDRAITFRLEATDNAFSLRRLDAVCTKEVHHIASRHHAIGIWSEVPECFPHCDELLWCQLSDLTTNVLQLLILLAERTERAITARTFSRVRRRH